MGGESKVWCGTGWPGQPSVWERDGGTWVAFGAYDELSVFDADSGERVDSVVVKWPNGDVDTVEDVRTSRRMTIVQGEGLRVPVMLLASPCAVMAYVMAREMGADSDFAVAAISATTLISAVTFSFWLIVV